MALVAGHIEAGQLGRFQAHLLGNSKRGQGVSAVALVTHCHVITKLSGSRKPGLKEYKTYRFAGYPEEAHQESWQVHQEDSR